MRGREDRYHGYTARLAHRIDKALDARVSVAHIAPSLLDLGRGEQITNCSAIMFADDTNILVNSSNNAVLEGNIKQTVIEIKYSSRYTTMASIILRREELTEAWWFATTKVLRANEGYRPVASSLTSPSPNQLFFHSLPELINPSHRYQFLPQHIPLPRIPHKHGLPTPLRSPLKLLTVVSSSSKYPLT
ncbi:hypothetical protein PR048_009543 [Dryococelus australis]|uniref:Uncharacterized protein n=1 Tax=Dryococelus australis TaxID=614101 RepID=A0ABQ9I065_9NEOP|nr:hypothetical protein PR048_009543 [Dryococelus australis]